MTFPRTTSFKKYYYLVEVTLNEIINSLFENFSANGYDICMFSRLCDFTVSCRLSRKFSF